MATQNLLELPPELLDQILGNFCPEGRAWSIVYGFAHGIYPGFPGSREFEWEYALTGFEAINPDYF